MILKDGLYRICNSFYCAGFVVKNGLITDCAPILRKKLIAIAIATSSEEFKEYLLDISEYIGE